MSETTEKAESGRESEANTGSAEDPDAASNVRDALDAAGEADLRDGYDYERDEHDLADLDFAGEAPPEGAIATETDFRVKRDENGDILPVWQELPGTDRHVLVRPIPQGVADRYLNEDDARPSSMDDWQQLRLIREFVIRPDFSDIEDPEDIEEFAAFGLDPLVMAIYEASGYDLLRGAVAQESQAMRAVEGNSSRGN